MDYNEKNLLKGGLLLNTQIGQLGKCLNDVRANSKLKFFFRRIMLKKRINERVVGKIYLR